MHAYHSSGMVVPVTHDSLAVRLRRLYAHAEDSHSVFASPLGPVLFDHDQVSIPRFVHFGPRETATSLRVAVYAGFDGKDPRPTDTVLRAIERLIATPDLNDGTSLTFFPLVDAFGFARGAYSNLSEESWLAPKNAQIALLARDVRNQAYDLFVRLDQASEAPGLAVARVTGYLPTDLAGAADEVLLSSDLEPLEVRFERDWSVPRSGPLTLSDDLGRPPVELHLSLPPDLDGESSGALAFALLSRLLTRYRAHQAAFQHI